MKNFIMGLVAALAFPFSNTYGRAGTGAAAAIASGAVVKVGARFGVAATAMATSGDTMTGIVETGGRVEIPKNTGVTYAVGQLLGYDFANNYVTTDLSGGVCIQVTDAAATGDTTVIGNLNPGGRRSFRKAIATDATDATNNYVDVDVGFPVVAGSVTVTALFHNTAGTCKAPTTLVIPSPGGANKIRIGQTDVVTNDVLHISVEETTGAAPT